MSNNKHSSYASLHSHATNHHAGHHNDDSDEENGSDLTPQQVERIYSQLSTHVHPLERKSGIYAQIVKYSQNVPMDKEYFVDVKDAFTAINLDSNKAQSNGEKRMLLWFGIRLSSVAAVLIRGLKPSINNITEWRNLILYDIVFPAAEQAYLFNNKKGFVKNKIESSDLVKELPPPSDGTILKLCGKYSPDGTSNGNLGGVEYPNGKIKRNNDTDVVPCGNYNQYVIAEPAQIRIKYIITAECRTNNTALKPTKDFMTIPQTKPNNTTHSSKSNIKSYFSKPNTSNNSSEKNRSEKSEKINKNDDESDEDTSVKSKMDSKGKKPTPQPSSHYHSPPNSPPHSPQRTSSSQDFSSPPSYATAPSSSSSSSPVPSSSKPAPSASPTSKKEVKNQIWQYFTHGGWRDFSDEHNDTVNKGSDENKRKFEVHINSTSYTIDTANSVQYQTNDPSKRRKIRVKPK